MGTVNVGQQPVKIVSIDDPAGVIFNRGTVQVFWGPSQELANRADASILDPQATLAVNHLAEVWAVAASGTAVVDYHPNATSFFQPANSLTAGNTIINGNGQYLYQPFIAFGNLKESIGVPASVTLGPQGEAVLPGDTTYGVILGGKLNALQKTQTTLAGYNAPNWNGPWTQVSGIGFGSIPGNAASINVNVTAGAFQFGNGLLFEDAANINAWNADLSISNTVKHTVGNVIVPAQLSDTVTIPANTASAGTEYIIEVPVTGVFETAALNLGILVGATFTNLLSTAATIFTAGDNLVGTIRLHVKIVTTGATGTAHAWIEGTLSDGTAARSPSTTLALDGYRDVLSPVDTTSNFAFSLAGDWGAAVAGQTITGNATTYTHKGS